MDTKTCPACMEEIHVDAKRCPHCTTKVASRQSDGTKGGYPWGENLLFVAIMVGLFILCKIVYLQWKT